MGSAFPPLRLSRILARPVRDANQDQHSNNLTLERGLAREPLLLRRIELTPFPSAVRTSSGSLAMFAAIRRCDAGYIRNIWMSLSYSEVRRGGE